MPFSKIWSNWVSGLFSSSVSLEMSLEEQIEKVSECGVELNDGATLEDFLVSFDRREYEEEPFELVMFVLGIEVEEAPWGRYFSNNVWNFDAECIEDDGSYVEIVQQFHRISGKRKTLTEVRDSINWETKNATLEYTIDGQKRKFAIEMDNDWVDPEVASQIISDFEGGEYKFYGKENGQSTIWFYLRESDAPKLNNLANNCFGLK